MPTPIDPKRLPGLKKALGSFADGDMASQKQLAEIYGVSPARLVTLIKSRMKPFPDAERRPDRTFWYPARAAIEAMISYLEGAGAQRKAQAARHQAVMSGVTDTQQRAAANAEAPPITAADIDRMASARTKIWRLQEAQREYVNAAEVRRAIRSANAIISREVMNLVNVVDPNGRLDGQMRDKIKQRCRQMLLKMHDELGALSEESNGGVGSASARAGSDRDIPRRDVHARARSMAESA